MWLAVARLPVNAQFAGADVLLLAAAALVGSLVVVQLLMQFEVVRRAEPHLTNVASKLLIGVDSGMLLQAARNSCRKRRI